MLDDELTRRKCKDHGAAMTMLSCSGMRYRGGGGGSGGWGDDGDFAARTLKGAATQI